MSCEGQFEVLQLAMQMQEHLAGRIEERLKMLDGVNQTERLAHSKEEGLEVGVAGKQETPRSYVFEPQPLMVLAQW